MEGRLGEMRKGEERGLRKGAIVSSSPQGQSKSQQSKIVHFIPKTGCTFTAAFHLLIIFYHKLPHISIAYI